MRITIDNTRNVLNEVDKIISEKLLISVLLIERSAKVLCPKRTGHLARSITHIVGERIGSVGTNVEYAPYVELGTSKMAAQPYLRPALIENLPEIKRIFRAK